MSKIFQNMRFQQIEKSLDFWRSAELALRPEQGWIRTIRTSLGMSLSILGQRLEITGAGVSKLEKSEASGAITLNSLRRVAEALDCELQYALVPKISLKDTKERQAIKKAHEHIDAVSHSMMLSGKEVDHPSRQLIFEELVKGFLDGSGKVLWSDTPKEVVKKSNTQQGENV